ncbi:RNA polymerase, sigma-24 subunit, RpoE [Cognatishimia maritima]|uniref:RNA polymerase sigma factor n=2 Tax=Cognatishimia maritima TaxID=870908 RepID=A0A1M5VVA7_9RHOB|nr:sigma-70 family RNA polymerase sigma factor [Cognatishimia maritima]SHH79128.1 RNA polymerase, sigma-24 subunit, RpoE [Cognatishimia maritima]
MLTLERTLNDQPHRAILAQRQGRGTRDTLNEAVQQDYSDQTVWMLAVKQDRDRAAFARLFDFYAPRLKGFVMRSGVSAAQAEEIVQEVMLTVWRKAHLFDPHRAQVSSWIYQIARNRQIDVLRKESRPMPEELSEELKDGGSPQEDASQIMAVEQEAQTLRMALARLKPGQREMVEKAYLGELSHSEIQAETGLPLGTIKSRIRLGLEKLRHELKELRADD